MMDALGFLLWLIIFCGWLSPKSFGSWLAKAEAGYRAGKDGGNG